MNDVTSEANQQPSREAQPKPKRGRKSREELRQERVNELRSKRVPLGRSTLTLDCEQYKEPGWAYRIFNDKKGRMAQAFAAGWELVTDPDKAKMAGEGQGDSNTDLGSAVSFVVYGKEGAKAYLMRIPEEIFSDNVAAGQSIVDDIDDAIHQRGGEEKVEAEGEKVYTKSGHGINHSRNRSLGRP